ncbi:MAG TPA: flagellar assembly protein FliX [Acetobacteraceae bacterium]|jgi:Class II flagellar assembly regulator
MTGIEGIGWPIRPRAVSRAASRSGFTMPPEPADTSQAAAAAETPAMSPASMLSLQEVGGETVEDREARRRGNDMLAALGELQRALLAGGGDAGALQRLVELSASVTRATDPRLAALVSAIVVRARVELARRQL